MVNDTRSGHKIKDDDSNSSKRRQIGGKGTISGSARTDASILRRSARETPLKKQTASSFSSTRKSERLEKWTPPTPLVKRKSERVEKQRISSPLRRSERGEKCRLLSSSGSKKSMKGLSSSDTKRKKGKREKSRKQLTFKPRDRSKNEKQDPKAACIIPKEKRLDARSYRAFLSPQARSARRAMKTDIELKRQDKLSQGDNNNAGTSASIEVQDGEDECSEIKREEPRKEYFARSHERHLERSSYGLRKFADGTSSNHGEVESSHFNRKRKNCPEEALESENGDGSSKCSDSPLQSSPHEETVEDAEMVQVDCSARAELQTPELIESTSEGRPLATYVDLGRGDKVGTCKTKSNTVIMYSDASVTAASKEIYSSNADTVSSSHSGSKRSNFVESCVACSKRPRVVFDSQKWKSCSSKAEEVCEQAAMSRSPQKDEKIISCIQKDENSGAKDNLDLNASELLPDAEKGELEAKVIMGLAEECDNDTQHIDHNSCAICKLGGKLLCCDGKRCKRSFHLSCLDPPLKDVPPGVWHCVWCIKKKIELGVYSVSQGIDSIWDSREVAVEDHKGIKWQKQYLVKYRGLAHIHNKWVPEIQLLLEAPMLLIEFNRKNQFERWKLEWTVPHRLLQKRLLMSLKQNDEYHSGHGSDIPNCRYEWLVKWSGLGYEHATWELENAAFLMSPEAMKLIRYYESCREKGKRAQDPSGADKLELKEELVLTELEKEGASGTPAGNGSQLVPRSTVNMEDINHVNHASSMPPVANDISEVPEVHMVESEERRKLYDAQKSLHLLLKPEMSKLSEILQLPEDVKDLVGRFLEYIMNNHHVNRESVTILQAFQISLCWTAAALLKHKIDRKESLALAKQCLNFNCKEEEAEFIYTKLRILKKMFLRHTGNLKELNSPKNPVPRTKDAAKILLHARASQSTASDQQELEGEIREISQSHYCFVQQVPAKQEQVPEFKMAQKSDFSRSIIRVEKIFAKRIKTLLQKQKEEFQEFNKMREEEKEKLEKEHRLESARTRIVQTHISVSLDKLKMLDPNFAQKMAEHNREMEISRKNLVAVQLAARNEEKKMKACWLEEVKSGKPVESVGKLLGLDSRFRVKHTEPSEQAGVHNRPKNATPMSGPSSEKQNPGGIVPGGHIPFEAPEAVPNEMVECDVSTETLTLSMESNRVNDGIDTVVTEGATVTRIEQHNSADNSNDGSMSVTSKSGPSEKQNPDGTVLSMLGEVPSEIPKTVPNILLEGGNPMGMGSLALESHTESDVLYTMASQRATVTGLKQHDREGISTGGDSPSLELTCTGLTLAETHITTAQCGPPPSHQVLPVGHCQVSIAARVRENDASSGDVQNSPQQVEVPSLQLTNFVLSDQSNHDPMVLQPVSQMQLPVSTTPPSAEHNQPDAPAGNGIHRQLSNEGHTCVHQTQVPTQPPVEDLAELSNHSVPQPVLTMQLHPPIESPVGGSETHVVDIRSTRSIAEISDRPVVSHSYPDPLQNEMERIHKEREQAIKIHEEMKLRLKSECDKEIEEVRSKYITLLQDAETSSIQKRKALETNYNKVSMSRLLAEAFRSKCSEARAAGTPGLQQDVASSVMQLSLQQPVQRPVSVAGPSLAGPQTTCSPTALPVQAVHSLALFSTNLIRPHSSPVTLTGNVSVGSEIRAPAPHLQSSRPAISMPAPIHISLPRAMSNQQSSGNPPPTQNLPVDSELQAPAPHLQPFRPAISMSVPDVPLLPHRISSQQSSSIPPDTYSMPSQLAPPGYLSGPFRRTHQPQNAGEFPLHIPSLSALELLMDVDNRAGANLPKFSPSMQDWRSTFDSWDASELAMTGSIRGITADTGAATDIVCLSDDE